MGYEFRGRTIEKIGVVGSGQIGPDIALYFAKVFSQHGVQVVVVDIAEDALTKGQAKVSKKIDKGVKTGAFKEKQASAMKDFLTFTSDYDLLKGSSLVVEAATEDQGLKGRIFAQLEALCSENTYFASNSSHMEPEVIFRDLEHKERSLVIHYFFPAERNPIVEIVPGRDTAPEVVDFLMGLYQEIGKIPIRVESRYGYAIDPVFEGLFQAAALCVEEGLGTVKEVDSIAAKSLGLGIGCFTAMNLTGGNPLTHHGLNNYTEKIMPWFRSPRILDEAMETGALWDTAARGETVEVAPEAEAKITDRMRGAYFGLVGEIIDSGITNIADIEMAIARALVIDAPFALMNKVGVDKALDLVKRYAADHEGFKVPQCIEKQAASGRDFEIPVVLRTDVDGVAVLTIRRPALLNALSKEIFSQISAHLDAVEAEEGTLGAVITGYGRKAFVSGMDITFLATIDSPETGEEVSRTTHKTFDRIAACAKPVIAAFNGLALGGGVEMSLACHARIARRDPSLVLGFPEVNLGLIPGGGGTQRLPRLIGVEKASRLLRTGRPVRLDKAVELGIVDRVAEGDLIEEAAETVRRVARGEETLRPTETGPVETPETLPEVELGHLSQAIDKILCQAIQEGAALPLSEGLDIESKIMGEACRTEDLKIGIQNFLKNGPKVKAEFVHR